MFAWKLRKYNKIYLKANTTNAQVSILGIYCFSGEDISETLSQVLVIGPFYLVLNLLLRD